MQIFKTSKLFFGKFPYKIVLSKSGNADHPMWEHGWTPKYCHKWIKDNKISHRVYTKMNSGRVKTRHVSMFMSIFVENEADCKKILSQFSKNVASVTKPVDITHIDVLKDNTNIIIRNSLLYKRFRYVVCFTKKYHYLQQVFEEDELNLWMSENFLKDVKDGEIKWDRFKWHQSGWNPRLYLSDEDDLVLVKLTWAERIRSITIVHTYDELTGSANNP